MIASDRQSAAAAAGQTDAARLAAVAVDGYIRRPVAEHLGELAAALAAAGFAGTLLVAGGDGRLSPVPRVRPTLAAVAVQAALAAVGRRWLQQSGLARGIVLRVGSVHSEVCLVGEAEPDPAECLLPERAVGGVASVLQQRSGRFVLMPPASLPAPGPACFGWGGRAPTLADAFLAIGYLGARSLGAAGRPLDRPAARDALAGLTGPGTDGVEAVALRACQDVAGDLAAAVRRRLKEAGLGGAPVAFLACGRTGGLLACAVAERLGWRTVHLVDGGGLVLTLGAAGMEPEAAPRPGFAAAVGRVSGVAPPAESTRAVYLGPASGWCDAPVHWAPDRLPGTVVAGPALIESPDAVHWVPPEWRYTAGAGGLVRLERR